MNFTSKLRQMLLGTSLPQEYMCVGVEEFDEQWSVHLTSQDRSFRMNVSACHLLLGYKPLVMALTFRKSSEEANWLRSQDPVCFSLVRENFTIDCQWKGMGSDRLAVAHLLCKKIRTVELGESAVFILEGETGEHQFLSPFHKLTNRLKEQLRRPLPGNVNLPGNLYDQVIIAYSIPRIISIVTFTEGDNMNMFPTDLHGRTHGKYYMSSLRIGGKANDQIEKSRTVVISRVDVSRYKDAYESGKNHMADPAPRDKFNLSSRRSKVSETPLPASVLSYVELRRVGSFDAGIHRIHSYEIIDAEIIAEGVTLAHVHRHPVQWRLNHGLFTKTYSR